METIRIGADELILWLRKNEKAENVPNDEITGLGRRIYNLIVCELGGRKLEPSFPCRWETSDEAQSIDKYNLPKTAAQYEISINQIGEMYRILNQW
jgi:hypothetical protein